MKGHEEECVAKVKAYLLSKGLVDSKNLLTEQDFRRVVIKRIHDATNGQTGEYAIIDHQPEASSEPIPLGGSFNGEIVLPKPSSEVKNIALEFHIKTPANYLQAAQGYQSWDGIKKILINTRTDDPELAGRFYDVAVQTLQDYFHIHNFSYGNIRKSEKGDLSIRPDWLDPSQIRLLERSPGKHSYEILLVPARAGGARNRITYPSGTTDKTKAEEICRHIRDYIVLFRAGQEGDKFSVKTIRQYLEKMGIERDAREAVLQSPDFKHSIMVKENTVLEVVSPYLDTTRDKNGELHHTAILKFRPPSPTGYGDSGLSTISENLNTSDPHLARLRMRTLNYIAINAMEDYFLKRAVSIIQETRPATQRRKSVQIKRFKLLAIEDHLNSDEIYFDDLRTHIQPQLEDYSRYIGWQTHIEGDRESGWVVFFQAMRNDGISLGADALSQEFAVRFENKDGAEHFSKELETAIIDDQYYQFGSRQRSVEQFRAPSANLVIKESLIAALQSCPEADLMGSNALTMLANTPTRQKA